MSSLPESSVPVESITALLGQITATGANAFGQISPTWRSSCRAAFAGKVRRIAAANELRPMAMRHRIFKLSPLSCVESLRIIQAPDPLHNWQSNNPTRTGPSPLSPSLSHAAWHCAGMSSRRSPKPPAKCSAGHPDRRRSTRLPPPPRYQKLSAPSNHAWPILRHRSSSLLSSRCRVFALQDRAIPAPQVTKITAIPLTGKSLLVVFDAERAGIII